MAFFVSYYSVSPAYCDFLGVLKVPNSHTYLVRFSHNVVFFKDQLCALCEDPLLHSDVGEFIIMLYLLLYDA